MDFEGLLQSRINPGEEGPSETIYDDLRTPTTPSRTRPTVLAPRFRS